jgi:hypothetical protein
MPQAVIKYILIAQRNLMLSDRNTKKIVALQAKIIEMTGNKKEKNKDKKKKFKAQDAWNKLTQDHGAYTTKVANGRSYHFCQYCAFNSEMSQ